MCRISQKLSLETYSHNHKCGVSQGRGLSLGLPQGFRIRQQEEEGGGKTRMGTRVGGFSKGSALGWGVVASSTLQRALTQADSFRVRT